jgi:hypothetical protein
MSGITLERIADIPSAPNPAGRSSEDLRQEIEAKKEAFAQTIDRLDQHVQRAVDWRAQTLHCPSPNIPANPHHRSFQPCPILDGNVFGLNRRW